MKPYERAISTRLKQLVGVKETTKRNTSKSAAGHCKTYRNAVHR